MKENFNTSAHDKKNHDVFLNSGELRVALTIQKQPRTPDARIEIH